MSPDSFHSVNEAAVENAEEAQDKMEQPDVNLDGKTEQEEPDANLKRPAEVADEPVAKRPKGSGTVSDMIDSVSHALSDTNIDIPWSAGFRELLLKLLPASLNTPPGQRNSSDDIMFRMLDEIFNVEEQRREAQVAKTQHDIDISKKKSSDATETMNSADINKKESSARSSQHIYIYICVCT